LTIYLFGQKEETYHDVNEMDKRTFGSGQ